MVLIRNSVHAGPAGQFRVMNPEAKPRAGELPLLEMIEAFLDAREMTAVAFCRRAGLHSAFVANLRRGSVPRDASVTKARNFMRRYRG